MDGRALFGSSVAWLAGLLTVAHPRLVEYSCNGYAETFYLFAFALGTAFLLRVFQTYSLLPALSWGLCFGLYSCVRSEGVLAFALSMVVCALVLHVRRRRGGEADAEAAACPGRRRIACVLVLAVVGFVASAGSYAALTMATVGRPGIFPRTTNLATEFFEQSGTRASVGDANSGRGASKGEAGGGIPWGTRSRECSAAFLETCCTAWRESPASCSRQSSCLR